MSQKAEKYARSLDRRMTALEGEMDRWSSEIASHHLSMLQNATRERNRARRDADTYRHAAASWKAVAYGSLAAASIVLALAIAKTLHLVNTSGGIHNRYGDAGQGIVLHLDERVAHLSD